MPKVLKPLNFVECYDPNERLWKPVPGMKCGRVSLSVVVLNSKLYARGGSRTEKTVSERDIENMKSAEVFDPEANTWTMIAPMLRPRRDGREFVPYYSWFL